MKHRHTALTLATAAALLVGLAPAAQAGPDPVDAQAAAILATASPGEPLTVVTTTQTSAGPVFSSEVASSRGEALDLLTSGLDEPATAVDIAHPVSIAGSTPRRTDDTLRGKQWGLSRLGAEKTWRKSTGKGVIVAVVDTGVRAQHPDLRGRVLRGWDFVASDRTPNDGNGHGTHVAGVIAATADNRRGVAGLAPSAKILPIRVLDSAGQGTTLAVARGIVHAVNKGADVINLSLAGDSPDAQVEAAVNYAIANDVLVVAAAGNQGCTGTTTYPAAYANVIGVGAIDRNGAIAPFSSCGVAVDVVAPGVDIWSTAVTRPGPGVPCRPGASYCTLSGTSMATPHVAAAAAILISRTRFRLSAGKVSTIIRSSADDIASPGRDIFSGFGVLNVRRMLAGR